MTFSKEKNIIERKEKLDSEKIGRSALTFNNYLDDYFGLIILIVVLIIFLGSFFLLWYPRFSQATTTIDTVKSHLDDEQTQLTKYKKSLIAYRDAYTEISATDKSKINDMIGSWIKYPAIYNADLLMTFQDLFNNNNNNDYQLKDMEIVEGEAKNKQIPRKKTSKAAKTEEDNDLPQGIAKIGIKANFEKVNYDELKQIISLLEKKLRLVDISNVEFSAKKETCSIEFTTYRFDKKI